MRLRSQVAVAALVAAVLLALPLLPLLAWVAGHPTVHAEQIRRSRLGSFFAR
jgi:hypothetical protein